MRKIISVNMDVDIAEEILKQAKKDSLFRSRSSLLEYLAIEFLEKKNNENKR